MKRNVKRQRSEYDGAESMAASGMAAFTIFRVLDDALLADRAGLRAMLAYPQMRGEAAEALVRIGPPAVDFADVFFEGLDSQKSTHSFAGAAALGAIGRDHPDVIDGLLRRLRSGPVAIRRGAAETLHYAGPPLAGRLDIAIDMLLGASRVPGLTCAAVFALGPLGRDSEAALRRVLELAGPRPVRLRAYEGFPDHQYDEVMFERGLAIHALRQFTRFADQVVPALVEALDSFKEYDSDLMQESGHERVCEALGPFGPLAAPAVPRLVRILEDWAAQPERPCEQPKDVFRVLAAIGPAAVAALPTLERLRPMLVDDESAELDPDEPVDRAISSLRQATENG
jgi:HEAT repeat protein